MIPDELSDSHIDKLVREVLVSEGKIIPESDKEIEMMEKFVKESGVELPESLRRPPTGPVEVRPRKTNE